MGSGDEIGGLARPRAEQRHGFRRGQGQVPSGPTASRLAGREEVPVAGIAPLQDGDERPTFHGAGQSERFGSPAHPPAGPLVAEVVRRRRRANRSHYEHIKNISLASKDMEE